MLGWDGKRIAMPYYDGDSVVAIKYRYPDGFKSYEQGSQHYLYNVNDVRAQSKTVIICEGESDTHAVWSAVDKIKDMSYHISVIGVPGVGTGMPSQKTWELYALEMIFAEKVYIAFDADNSGDAGAKLAMSILGDKSIRMRPTVGNDMAEHLMKGGSLVEAGMDEADLRVPVA
jgi:5S rRNA maturation endonuclease (ribonuclease M5)